jgi:hypothetical protein
MRICPAPPLASLLSSLYTDIFPVPSSQPPIPPVVRIFSVLATLAWLSLVLNFFLGLWIGDFNAAAQTYRDSYQKQRSVVADKSNSEEVKDAANKELGRAGEALKIPRQRMTLHFYVGVASSLLVVLVNSVTVTYFVGTSKWCKEVGETYDLNPELPARSTLIKRRTFPWSVMGMLAIVVLVLLGGLSDPSIPLNQSHPGRSPQMVQWHYLAAMGTLAFMALTFAVQAMRIYENSQAIGAILAEVRRIRLAKGLPVGEDGP